MKAVVVAHGGVVDEDRAALDGADVIVAADGGALALERWEVVPHFLVGDLDSLTGEHARRFAERGTIVVKFPVEKDETDLEIALRYALEAGALEVIVLGAFGGGRLDHEIANVLLLADPRYRGRGVVARRGATRVFALHGGERAVLEGRVSDLVSLIPVRGDAHGVNTSGLRYGLAGATLVFGRTRGASNVIVSRPAAVALDDGVLLVAEAPATLDALSRSAS